MRKKKKCDVSPATRTYCWFVALVAMINRNRNGNRNGIVKPRIESHNRKLCHKERRKRRNHNRNPKDHKVSFSNDY